MQLLKSLADRLAELAGERRQHEDDLKAVRIATGRLLVEVQEDDDLTMKEAAAILGLSRETVFCLVRDAREAAT